MRCLARLSLRLGHFPLPFTALVYFRQFIFSLRALRCHLVNCLLFKLSFFMQFSRNRVFLNRGKTYQKYLSYLFFPCS